MRENEANQIIHFSLSGSFSSELNCTDLCQALFGGDSKYCKYCPSFSSILLGEMLVESFDIAVEGEIDCFDQDSSFVGVDGYSGIFVEYLIQVMSRVHLLHVMI